jgi:hypothetical protein
MCTICGCFDHHESETRSNNNTSTVNISGMMSCACCGVFAHRPCADAVKQLGYGVNDIPAPDQATWVCDTCVESNISQVIADQPLNTTTPQKCSLCPVKGGYMIKCSVKGDTSSSSSTIANPRTFFAHGGCLLELHRQRKPVNNDLPCSGCGLAVGVRVQCEHRYCRRVDGEFGCTYDEYIQCSRVFHVKCAEEARLTKFKCHDHSANALESRLLGLLRFPQVGNETKYTLEYFEVLKSRRDAKLVHMGVSLLKEFCWAHLPIGGRMPHPKLLSFALNLRRNLLSVDSFEMELNQLLSPGMFPLICFFNLFSFVNIHYEFFQQEKQNKKRLVVSSSSSFSFSKPNY